jgi:hypothetical protein
MKREKEKVREREKTRERQREIEREVERDERAHARESQGERAKARESYVCSSEGSERKGMRKANSQTRCQKAINIYLKLQVHEAISSSCMRPYATSV